MLSVAAQKGDPRAQLEYGLNAKGYLANRVDGSILGELALHRLEASAKAGLIEGYLATAEAYRSGWYGTNDPIKAATYLYALSYLDPSAISIDDLDNRTKLLRTGDRDAAQNAARRLISDN